MQKRTININGLDIHYLVSGAGEAVVIIHGGGDGALRWGRNAKILSSKYRAYAPDLPGFGLSHTVKTSFDFSDYILFIHNFTHGMGLTKFHLIGHSIGACISLQYALSYPERVSKLVLVSSFCLGEEVSWWVRLFSRPFFNKIIGFPVLAAIKTFNLFAGLFSKKARNYKPLSRIKMDMGEKLTTLKGQRTILKDRLKEVQNQTLVVWGEKDLIVPAHHSFMAAKILPNGKAFVFEKCGHMVYKQETEKFSELILGFLGSPKEEGRTCRHPDYS